MTVLATRASRWTPLGVAAVVLGFVAWWPVGLAALAYIYCGGSVDQLVSDAGRWLRGLALPVRGTGNAAFDAYRERTLKRLEEEQAEFAGFVRKLREARDQDEFDRFMAERSKASDAS